MVSLLRVESITACIKRCQGEHHLFRKKSFVKQVGDYKQTLPHVHTKTDYPSSMPATISVSASVSVHISAIDSQ